MKPKFKDSITGIDDQDIRLVVQSDQDPTLLESPNSNRQYTKPILHKQDDLNLISPQKSNESTNDKPAQSNSTFIPTTNTSKPLETTQKDPNNEDGLKDVPIQDTNRPLLTSKNSTKAFSHLGAYKERLRSHFLTLEKKNIESLNLNQARDILDHSERVYVSVIALLMIIGESRGEYSTNAATV